MYLKCEIVLPDQYNHLMGGGLQGKSFCPEVGAQPLIPLAELSWKDMFGATYVFVGSTMSC